MLLNILNPYLSVALILIIIGVPTIYGGILLYRYSQPFRLFKASTKEKWGWAAKAAFFLFLPYLFLGIFYPIITPDQKVSWWTALYCVGFWLLIYPFLILGLMIRFGFDQAVYGHMSKSIKKWNGAGFNFPFSAPFFIDKETRRFFREGFPEEIIEGKQRDLQALQKEKPIYQSPSPDDHWQLRVYGPTKKSPVFYAYFKNNLQSAEEYLFSFGFFEKPEQLSVFWKLPNQVCGLYLADLCYALFYYGDASRPIKRYHSRTRKDNYLSQNTIAWFGNLENN